MSEMVFDTPWWVLAALVGVALVLFFSANRRLDKTLRNVSFSILGIAAMLAVISFVVETDVERVTKRTRELVAAVDQRDWARLESLLDPKVHFAGWNGPKEISDQARFSAERFGFKGTNVTKIEPMRTGTLITVDVTALTELESAMGRTIPSTWRLEWQNFGNDWTLLNIELLPDVTGTSERIRDAVAR
jgi:hypothetical protein